MYIEFTGIKMYTKYKIVPFCPYQFVRTILSNTILSVYHFVHTILSVPFSPIPLCPYTILSIPFCTYHFVRYHFVLQPGNHQQLIRYINYNHRPSMMVVMPSTTTTSATTINGMDKI